MVVKRSVPGAGPEARQRAYERQQANLAAARADVTARLVEKYLTEPDRDYADDMWGEMLRERGVDTTTLVP